MKLLVSRQIRKLNALVLGLPGIVLNYTVNFNSSVYLKVPVKESERLERTQGKNGLS